MNIRRFDNRNTLLSSSKLVGSSSSKVVALSTELLSFNQFGPKSWKAISPTLMSRSRRLTCSTVSFLGILEILVQKSRNSLHLDLAGNGEWVFAMKRIGS